MRSIFVPGVMATVLASALAGCGQPRQLYIDGAWVRLAAVAGQPAAAYFTVHGGQTPQTLINVTSDVAIRSEMHASMSASGSASGSGAGTGVMTTMTPIARLPVPAKATIAFTPGGRHVMLFGLNPGVKRGDMMTFTFTFADGTRILRDANVVAAGDPPPK